MKVKKTYSEKLFKQFLCEFEYLRNDFRGQVYEKFVHPLYRTAEIYITFDDAFNILTKIDKEIEKKHLKRIEDGFKDLLDRLDFLEKENKKLVNVIIRQRQLLNK